MAGYYHENSEIQADNLQTLFLMNPNYIQPYSDTQPPPNILLLNPHAPPHFVGVPLPTSPITTVPPPSGDSFAGISPRFHYNISNSNVNQHPQFPPRQGLSLSLSSEKPGYRAAPLSEVSSGSFIVGSKYLRVVQKLLDEVVSVEDGVVDMKEKLKVSNDNGKNVMNDYSKGEGDGFSGGKQRSELTTSEKQVFHMKNAKLISMLDEVERKYRQYGHQMQVAVTSFEQAAGIGSAKSYTALALQTISKKFRCLKDAISSQIKATSKSLGEDESSLNGKVEGSKLKFVDHQLRQQRALQQLGMMHHNAWRPQRGLPEKAVTVLRAWLFEHFLHPYPKDSDKHMLAKQTGLTRSQVSNWFINARVRLWKPMVEEMYMEEFKEHDQQKGSSQTPNKNESNKSSNPKSTPTNIPNIQINQIQTLNSTTQEHKINHNTSPTKTSTSPTQISFQAQAPFALLNTPKRPRHETQNSPISTILSTDMDTKHSVDHTSKSIFNEFLGGTSSGYGIYDEQLTTNFHGNGVSLSLGLPHYENYLSNQTIQFGAGRPDTQDIDNQLNGINILQASNSGYENMNIQNKKRFATQLLQNFVT